VAAKQSQGQRNQCSLAMPCGSLVEWFSLSMLLWSSDLLYGGGVNAVNTACDTKNPNHDFANELPDRILFIACHKVQTRAVSI